MFNLSEGKRAFKNKTKILLLVVAFIFITAVVSGILSEIFGYKTSEGEETFKDSIMVIGLAVGVISIYIMKSKISWLKTDKKIKNKKNNYKKTTNESNIELKENEKPATMTLNKTDVEIEEVHKDPIPIQDEKDTEVKNIEKPVITNPEKKDVKIEQNLPKINFK